MPRPFTHAQALQNIAFLRALRRTGNASDAGRHVGIHRSTFESRRRISAAFAADWDAALAVAHAHLHDCAEADRDRDTVAEPRIIRTAGGKLQLRRPRRGRLTRADEQAFLAALSATANIRLQAEPDHIKRRRGESREAHSYRLSAIYRAGIERAREAFRVAEAERRAAGRPSPFGPEDIAPLPALDQVTGWSKAELGGRRMIRTWRCLGVPVEGLARALVWKLSR